MSELYLVTQQISRQWLSEDHDHKVLFIYDKREEGVNKLVHYHDPW